MAVRFRSAVKAVCAGSAGKLSDFADIGQQRQIPIYSSKADIGINSRRFSYTVSAVGWSVLVIRNSLMDSRWRLYFSVAMAVPPFLIIITITNISIWDKRDLSIGNFSQSLTTFFINDKLNNRKAKGQEGRVFHRKRSRESPAGGRRYEEHGRRYSRSRAPTATGHRLRQVRLL